MNTLTKILGLLWMIGTLCAPAFATETYYVDKLGNDGNSCATAQTASSDRTKAKLTTNAGWSCLSAADGDTLIIGAGTYIEQWSEAVAAQTNFVSGTNYTNAATIKARSGEVVTIRPGTTAYGPLYISNKQFIKFEDLVFDAVNIGAGGSSAYTAFNADSIRFTRCQFKNSPNFNGALISTDSSFNEFLTCTFSGNGFNDGYGHGIYVTGSDTLIDGSTFSGNYAYGVHFYNSNSSTTTNRNIVRNSTIFGNGLTTSPTGACGIILSSGDANKAYNNIVYGHSTNSTFTCGIMVGVGGSPSTNAVVYNNTIVNNGAGYQLLINSQATGTIARNNAIVGTLRYSNAGVGTITSNNIEAAAGTGSNGFPLFVNYSTKDYRVAAQSNLKGAGMDLHLVLPALTTDYAGETRVVPWDVGAYKYIDFTPPTVSISGPANGATVSGSTVAVMANATDDVGVVGVQFKLDGSNLGSEDTIAPYSVTWDSTLSSNALHVLTAVARDAAGNSATSAAISVTVNNAGAPDAAPQVSITNPANGATVSGTITVSANATDDVSVSGVQFKLDGVNLGSEDTSAPYGVSWSTLAAGDGAHTLLAVARDGAGHTTISTAVNVMVNNPPPTISGVSAGSITTSAATITWTTSTASNSQVEYGTTTSYGFSTVLDASLVTSHSQGLTGLAAFTLYHYRVKSTDSLAQQTISGDNTFTTAASGATTITVTRPAGGETWVKGNVEAINWTKTDDLTGNVRVLVSRNGGATFRTIINSVAASALTVPWPVTAPSCNNCMIRINSLVAPAVFDNSAQFQIVIH